MLWKYFHVSRLPLYGIKLQNEYLRRESRSLWVIIWCPSIGSDILDWWAILSDYRLTLIYYVIGVEEIRISLTLGLSCYRQSRIVKLFQETFGFNFSKSFGNISFTCESICHVWQISDQKPARCTLCWDPIVGCLVLVLKFSFHQCWAPFSNCSLFGRCNHKTLGDFYYPVLEFDVIYDVNWHLQFYLNQTC